MRKIVSATADDIPQLCALLSILFSQEADFQPDASKQAAALPQIIALPAVGRILVLREGNEVIGMVSLLFSVSTACGGKVAWLEDLVVHPSRRGEGLGQNLMKAALELAQQEACLRVSLLTDRANEAAIRFYQRYGFGMSAMIPLRLMLKK